MNVELNESEILVPANTLSVAMSFMAKHDGIFYLNGICVRKDGFVNATNGHVLFSEECDFTLDNELIIRPYNNIPAKAVDAVINTTNRTIVLYGSGSEVISEIMFEYIEGNFPDTNKLIPSLDKEIENKPVGFNADYLKLLPKAFSRGCVMHVTESKGAILFTSQYNPKRKVVLMPMRID